MKQKPLSYCEVVAKKRANDPHRIYHDTCYGFRAKGDDELFERFMLEINQAGLSWDIILKKQEHFRRAFDGFIVKKVARYGDADRARLMADVGIVRNRLKIEAAVYNAGVILRFQKEFGSFMRWLDMHHPQGINEWTRLFQKTFRFTGGEIVKEFLLSTGYLPGAHIVDCPVAKKIVLQERGDVWKAADIF